MRAFIPTVFISSRRKNKYWHTPMLILFSCILTGEATIAQDGKGENKIRSMNVTAENYSSHFFILNHNGEKDIKENVTYFWYNAGKIHSNEEGYSGLLLHEKFQKYDMAGHMVQSGCFRRGLKIGIWKKWNNQGDLIEKAYWKKGRLKERLRYSAKNKLISHTQYKNGRLDGKCLIQKNEKDTVIYYRRGEPYTPLLKKLKRLLAPGTEHNKSETDTTDH